jgi:hypothetical protein
MKTKPPSGTEIKVPEGGLHPLSSAISWRHASPGRRHDRLPALSPLAIAIALLRSTASRPLLIALRSTH